MFLPSADKNVTIYGLNDVTRQTLYLKENTMSGEVNILPQSAKYTQFRAVPQTYMSVSCN